MVQAAEFFNLLVAAGLLAAELVAGEAEHHQAFILILLIKGLQAIILGREAALGSGVHHQQHLALEVGEIHHLPLVAQGAIVVDAALPAGTGGILHADALAAVVEVDDHIVVVAHAEFLHIGELAKAVTGLDALHEVLVLLVVHGVDDIHAGLVEGEDVGRGEYAHVRSHNCLCLKAFAVAGHRHVAHHVHIGHVFAEVVDGSLGGLGDALHEFFFSNAPHVVGAFPRVYPGLPDATVGAADAYVLVAAAETAHGVALEVSESDHGIVVQQVLADGHLLEPLAAVYRQKGRALGIHDVHGAEGPAVHLQCLAMLLGSVAVAFVIGIGLDYVGALQVLLHQGFDPFAGDDVGAVLLARVKLDAHAAFNLAIDLFIGLDQALGGQIAGKIDHGLAVSLLAAAGKGRQQCGKY